MLGETIASALTLEETSFVLFYQLCFDANGTCVGDVQGVAEA